MPEEMQSAQKGLPRHIAVIMDGNGRWAKQRHLPRFIGHKAGVDTVRRLVSDCVQKHIEVLTLFAFSSENWKRPFQEVSYLMQLFRGVLSREIKKCQEQNIQLRFIGDRNRFDDHLQEKMHEAEVLTANNTGLKLVIAVNYGGQWDIQQAVQRMVKDIQNHLLTADAITAEWIEKRLSLADCPPPDLLIRTSGEQRLSNFMLWQCAYTELYFTPVYWPDFTLEEFEKALDHFKNRERRFGLTGEQLESKESYA